MNCRLATVVFAMASVAGAGAQPSRNAFAASWAPGGILRVSDGARSARIDLSKDIAGCLGQLYDRTTGERFGSAEGRHKVLDITETQGHRYLLLSAVAAPNCNVQGRCGAGDANVTLIWLKVTPDLAVAAKNAFAVEDCVAPRWVDDQAEGWRDKLALVDGVLTLRFTEATYPPALAVSVDVPGRVSYDRRAAASGIVVLRPSQENAATELMLREIEQRLAAAWVKGDRTFIESLLADDWTVTDQTGRVLTKRQVLDETFASNDRRIESMTIDDVRVRLLDGAAVVTGRTRATGSYRGQTATATLRFTDVFHFRDGKWRIVASHGTVSQ